MDHPLIASARASTLALAISLVASPVCADGLADLKSALARLNQPQTPLRAAIEMKNWQRESDGKKLDEAEGMANVLLEEASKGMQLTFSPDTLARVETELRQRGKGSKSKTPTQTALEAIRVQDLRAMSSSAAVLAREIEAAQFVSERADTFNDKPARLLSFTLPQDKASNKKGVEFKKFESTLDIWIATDGTPLASKAKQTASANVMLFLSIEQSGSEDRDYRVLGDRLLMTRKEERQNVSAAGEKKELRSTLVLQVQT